MVNERLRHRTSPLASIIVGGVSPHTPDSGDVSTYVIGERPPEVGGASGRMPERQRPTTPAGHLRLTLSKDLNCDQSRSL
jgi:hypothetical protein